MAAKAVLEHITTEIPNATHAVLYANNDLHSPNFGAWIVHPVGPGKEYERLEDFEGAYILDRSQLQRYPVAYVELMK